MFGEDSVRDLLTTLAEICGAICLVAAALIAGGPAAGFAVAGVALIAFGFRSAK